MAIRTFIVEDQPAILKSQVKLLNTFEDIAIVGTAMSGEEAIDEIFDLDLLPQVVLCDLGLPGMNGIDVTRRVKSIKKEIEVLMFTVFEDEKMVLDAIRAGASGYILKGAPAQKLHQAIVDVFHGGSVIQPNLARRLLKFFSKPEGMDPNRYEKAKHTLALTKREEECLQLIAKGLSNVEIASVLNVATATIRTHLEHIYQKFDVTNRVEAVTEGIRQGIIEL